MDYYWLLVLTKVIRFRGGGKKIKNKNDPNIPAGTHQNTRTNGR
jgi:hypothetical protein